MSGILFIISSPSGGGKGTLIREVLRRVPNIGYSISFTTREPRAGEENGRDYFFVNRLEFENLIEQDEFLEHAVVHGNYYGTSRRVVEHELDSGRDVILEIDVQGATAVKQSLPEAVRIFILPPNFQVLRERLERRASENPLNLATRLANSGGEVGRYHEFDYILINDEIERAATVLAAIFYAERSRTVQMEAAAKAVFETFPKTN